MRHWTSRDQARIDQLDRLSVDGIELFAQHGVFEHERLNGQTFVVDLAWWIDTEAAGRSDDLDATINYALLTEVAARAFAQPVVDLIETAGWRLAQALFDAFPMDYLELVIHKPEAPLVVAFKDVNLRLRLARGECDAGAATESNSAAVKPTYRADGQVASGAAAHGAMPRVSTRSTIPGDSGETMYHDSASIDSLRQATRISVVTSAADDGLDGPDALGIPGAVNRLHRGDPDGFTDSATAADAASHWGHGTESADGDAVVSYRTRPASDQTTGGGSPISQVSPLVSAPDSARPGRSDTRAGGSGLGPRSVTPATSEAIHDQLEPPTLQPVVWSIGSNIEPRLNWLQFAVTGLATTPGIERLAVSSVWSSAPVGVAEQPDFLNIVVRAWSALDPYALLERGQELEWLAGRRRPGQTDADRPVGLRAPGIGATDEGNGRGSASGGRGSTSGESQPDQSTDQQSGAWWPWMPEPSLIRPVPQWRAEEHPPRTLDIDLIAIGDLVIEDPRLTIPHPRAYQRAFVLRPWLEVEPAARLADHHLSDWLVKVYDQPLNRFDGSVFVG
ncbi:MAG: dihydroneopterin aldolase [Propionibacteriaceae bacterium]|nr:dihydroneopterin aldolase [Propionibacteriaceae bacterium]